jgi:transcriptional regulator
LDLLNPQKDILRVKSSRLVKMLPILFLSEGVTEYGTAYGLVSQPKLSANDISRLIDPVLNNKVPENFISPEMAEEIKENLEKLKDFFQEKNKHIERRSHFKTYFFPCNLLKLLCLKSRIWGLEMASRKINGQEYFKLRLNKKIAQESKPIFEDLFQKFKKYDLSFEYFGLYLNLQIGEHIRPYIEKFLINKVNKDRSNPTYQRYQPVIRTDLMPYERLLKVDLRKKESQIIDEFKKFLSYEIKVQSAANNLDLKAIPKWKSDNSRFRKEGWNQLKVLKMRNQGISFPEIASRIGIQDKKNTGYRAKQMYYAAFEKIYGTRYDKNFWNQQFKDALLTQLKTDDGFSDDKKLWDKWLKSEEGKQQEHLIKRDIKKDRDFGDPYESDIFNKTSLIPSRPEDADTSIREQIIKMDIIKTCKKCKDTECCSKMLKGLENYDFTDCDPCEEIHKILLP